MTLAIFDLDNTLIAGDSDHLWGEFLIDQGIVDADGFKAANDGFFQDYQDGRLDIFAYQEFVLGVLKGRPLEELDRLRQRYMDTVIDSIWLPAAEQLIADHRERGHTLMIITATNDFITAPIAARLLHSERKLANPGQHYVIDKRRPRREQDWRRDQERQKCSAFILVKPRRYEPVDLKRNKRKSNK